MKGELRSGVKMYDKIHYKKKKKKTVDLWKLCYNNEEQTGGENWSRAKEDLGINQSKTYRKERKWLLDGKVIFSLYLLNCFLF